MPATDQGVHPERYQLIPRVLIFITQANEVLLLKGAPTKRIWAGKYNGVGGHVERDEDIYSAAQREIFEETSLTVSDLRLRGLINIDTGQPIGIGMFVFTAVAASRETISSSEGALEWVPFDQVQHLALVEDLPRLLPKILSQPGEAALFFGRYWYDAQGQLQIQFAEANEIK